jgi:hypothetical protein
MIYTEHSSDVADDAKKCGGQSIILANGNFHKFSHRTVSLADFTLYIYRRSAAMIYGNCIQLQIYKAKSLFKTMFINLWTCQPRL